MGNVNQLQKKLLTAINTLSDSSNGSKTYTSTVIKETISVGGYIHTVVIEGSRYDIFDKNLLKQGQQVKVVIPNGIFENMYIENSNTTSTETMIVQEISNEDINNICT